MNAGEQAPAEYVGIATDDGPGGRYSIVEAADVTRVPPWELELARYVGAKIRLSLTLLKGVQYRNAAAAVARTAGWCWLHGIREEQCRA